MKVLQINNHYKHGSTGKIVWDLHKDLMEHGIESFVCYGRGADCQDENVYRICSNFYARVNKFFSSILGLAYGGCRLSTRKLKKIIQEVKPDIVHLQCINGNIVNIYKLIEYLKENKIKTVLTLHAEFMYTANCGYSLSCDNWKTGCGDCPQLKVATNSYLFDRTNTSWMLMKESFEGFDDDLVIASVSPWLLNRALLSPFLGDKQHRVVLNGIDTNNIFYYRNNTLRERHKVEDKNVILHVTASFSNPIKGGEYLIELAKRMPEVIFIVIGNDDSSLNLPKNIIDLGRMEDQKLLAQYYSMADLFVLTSEKETFCMPVAESLCCGTPIVGFKAGAPEQIALKQYSQFVEFGNVDLLMKSVNQELSKIHDKEKISTDAINVYSKDRMTSNYLDIYRDNS